MSKSESKKELRIGLELHIQLDTKSKLFCTCANKEAKPNSLTCPICLGMPGTKPSLNKAAVESCLKLALALNCSIPSSSTFSRKTYFYPDLAKNFQITQYEMPIAKDGKLKLGGKEIRIRRIQLEEDPASLKHEPEHVLIDYNRSGIPLAEIVTEPDFSSAKEVKEFLIMIKQIIQYIRVFKKEGKFRVDVNVSLGKHARVEIKNITGFKEIEKAAIYEVKRQEIRLNRGMVKEAETRWWNAATATTKLVRLKETEEEYGYIFEPDLPKLTFSSQIINKIKAQLPELPYQKVERLKQEYKINEELAASIATDLELANIYEAIIKKLGKAYAALIAQWFAVYLKKILNWNNITFKESKLDETKLINFMNLILKKKVSDRAAELILRQLTVKPVKIEQLAKQYQELNEAEQQEIVDKVLKENPKAIDDYKKDTKVLHWLVGKVIRKSKARIDAKKATQLLKKKLEK